MTANWKHNDLAADLAAHLRGYAKPAMIWTDMQLGPAGSPRPDVYSIEPTYKRLNAMAYEVKISRADFLADVTSGKALSYLTYAGALAFAVPKGLVRKDEVPAGCGLIERGDTGWRWAKKPKINPIATLPFQAWMKLLMDGRRRDVGAGNPIRVREYTTWKHAETVRRVLGEELARMVRNRDDARHRLQEEIARLELERSATGAEIAKIRDQRLGASRKELEDVKAELAKVATIFGLDPGAQAWEIKRALSALRPDGDRKALRDAASLLRRNAKWQIEHAEELEMRLGDQDRELAGAGVPPQGTTVAPLHGEAAKARP